MGNIVKKQDLINILAEKTGFYKMNIKDMVEALSETVLETLESATFEEDSEIHLMNGLVISGHRVPERECVNPKTGESTISPEKVIPKATFKQSLRLKMYEELTKQGKKKR